VAWHSFGNKPINSTGLTGPIGAGSTATLFAELDSTMLGTANFKVGQSMLVQVTYVMGADTVVTWQAGVCNSTATNSGVDEFFPKTPTAQSAQYILQHVLEKDQRIRIRQQSSGAGGAAYLSAVPLL
jgi:hypothetical protein